MKIPAVCAGRMAREVVEGYPPPGTLRVEILGSGLVR